MVQAAETSVLKEQELPSFLGWRYIPLYLIGSQGEVAHLSVDKVKAIGVSIWQNSRAVTLRDHALNAGLSQDADYSILDHIAIDLDKAPIIKRNEYYNKKHQRQTPIEELRQVFVEEFVRIFDKSDLVARAADPQDPQKYIYTPSNFGSLSLTSETEGGWGTGEKARRFLEERGVVVISWERQRPNDLGKGASSHFNSTKVSGNPVWRRQTSSLDGNSSSPTLNPAKGSESEALNPQRAQLTAAQEIRINMVILGFLGKNISIEEITRQINGDSEIGAIVDEVDVNLRMSFLERRRQIGYATVPQFERVVFEEPAVVQATPPPAEEAEYLSGDEYTDDELIDDYITGKVKERGHSLFSLEDLYMLTEINDPSKLLPVATKWWISDSRRRMYYTEDGFREAARELLQLPD